MSETFKVGLIQNHATAEVEACIAQTLEMSREAAAQGAQLICLPEYFSGLEVLNGRLTMPSFPEAGHPALPAFRALARELGLWFLLGSLPIEVGGGKINNRGYLVGPDGGIAARYDKIHLFDVDLAGGESYRESATIAPGAQAILADLPWGKIGLSVCYDLRFPQLYRALAQAGADFLAVPAAFTRTTGQAHWHVLQRARAIENGCYVIAPCQTGEHEGGGACYGHSLVVDPWGQVIADGGEDEGIVVAEIDPAEVTRARAMIPALEHDRAFAAPDGLPQRLTLGAA